MKKILIVLAMVLGLLVSGCATSRVWQNNNIKTPSTKEEVISALDKCESTEIVSSAHKKCHAWRIESWSTVLIPFVNFIGIIGLKSAQTDYAGALVNCMREENFNYFEYSEGLNWDYHSGHDISKSEWLEKQKPKEEDTYKYRTRPLPESKSLSSDKELFIASDQIYARYYHRSDCDQMAHIHQNRVKLTREQAEAKGMKPCPICKP